MKLTEDEIRKKKKGGKVLFVLLLLALLAGGVIYILPRVFQDIFPALQERLEPILNPVSDPEPEAVPESVVPADIPDDAATAEDELTPEEWISYLKALLERSEAQLEEALAKGSAADPESVKELKTNIPKIREEIRRREQND